MKGVQCYELFGGIALKNHTFSFSFLAQGENIWMLGFEPSTSVSKTDILANIDNMNKIILHSTSINVLNFPVAQILCNTAKMTTLLPFVKPVSKFNITCYQQK